jgi:DNA-binding GntR family transcriptional regulator
MNIHDWITIFAAAIVVVGWFVNSALNRRHEIAKKRMEYRLDALHSFVPVFFAMKENRVSDDGFVERLTTARTKFQLYCHKDEIDTFERLAAAIEARDAKAYTDALRDLARLVRDGVRGELGLDKYEYPK